MGTTTKKPDFSRVPDEEVRKGIRMLRAGKPALQVAKKLGVSYPTVLKWKHEFVQSKAGEVLDHKEEEFSSKRRDNVDAASVIAEIVGILKSGCAMTLSEDRGRFIARIEGLGHPDVFVQDKTAPLAMFDAAGKWKRIHPNGEQRHSPLRAHN